ncbi:hypothetical protein GCM10023085_65610 [Actinomadura viridis]|uniref:Uncharacterized protein n=1 Tax=Actinomadura viridis TaxID=58110 RepID=A0A931DUN7_9ACTN|nr:hypothetical protein [Actinomadura viridis]MBG6093023.1 hypothetical protein [Actinomadura viridis]
MISPRPSTRAFSRACALTAQAGRALARWSPRRWAVAAVAAAATALVVGVPTDVVPNPLFGRSIPVQWWNHPILVLTAVLAGLVIATYTGPGAPSRPGGPAASDRWAACCHCSPSAARCATRSCWSSSGPPAP